jgi:3-oxoacyl-[acyl-carrier-protein] synthase-3
MGMPANVVTNEPIAARLGVDDRWIRKRTGVVERRIAGPDDTLTSLAAAAGRKTIEVTGIDAGEIDLVIVATASPDMRTPNAASLVAGQIEGIRSPGAIDVNSACVGWLDAVAMAAGMVEAGRSTNALVIGAEVMSRYTNPDDRGTASLFADGAGAALVAATDGASRIGPVVLGCDPEGGDLIAAGREEAYVRMKGAETFGAAVARMSEASVAALDAAGMTVADIDLFVYHQANIRILDAVAEKLDLPRDRLVVTVDHFGNTSAATIPIALAEATADGRLVDGMKLLLSAFGAGFTWGATVVEWGAG